MIDGESARIKVMSCYNDEDDEMNQEIILVSFDCLERQKRH